MRTQNGFAPVNGTRLYYEIARSGRPLVLIHGFSFDGRMWDDQFEPFARRFRVVRYDARGFGRSGPPTGEAFDRLEDLKALLDYLEIERAHIVGLSMGGSIAVEFAIAHPERVGAIVPAAPRPNGFRWRELSESLDSVYSAGRNDGVEAAREVWLRLEMYAPALANPTVASRFKQMVFDYSGWHWVNSDPCRYLDPPARDRLEAIGASTLVITGEMDSPVFRLIAKEIERRVPTARAAVVVGAGHMVNMEAPAEFNKLVLSFLAES